MPEPFKDQLMRVRMMGMDRCSWLSAEESVAINAVLYRYDSMLGALTGVQGHLDLPVINMVIAQADGSSEVNHATL
jgi:hypothetical protein